MPPSGTSSAHAISTPFQPPQQPRQQRGRRAAQHPVRLVVDLAGVAGSGSPPWRRRAAPPRPARPPATPRPRCRPPASARRRARRARRPPSRRSGSISPNQTTPGRSRLPQSAQRGGSPGTACATSQPRPLGQGCSQRSAQDVAMQPDRLRPAGALVQVIDVLRDDGQHAGAAAAVVGQRHMPGVRLRRAHGLLALGVPGPDARRVGAEALLAGQSRPGRSGSTGRSSRRGRWGCRSPRSCPRR